jgi:hypothetical protein
MHSDRHLFDLFADAVGKGDLVARKHRQKAQSEIERIVEEGWRPAFWQGRTAAGTGADF